MIYRTGQGIDFHRLVVGKPLWLGGVRIPSGKGCDAHSDGDALLHAICDALLGAAGLNDIGHYFPDTDEAYQNIDSKILLEKTISLVKKEGYSVSNIDSTVCLEKPRIAPFVPEMKKIISAITGVDENSVSVKATTTEKMGFAGRGEGLFAIASVLLTRE
ncbi:MAG: 2-C-methyl-D-erythritol 2,4-cyclodiphosphate synthase [Bacteroidales bacterium]|nr:2-C-methyl-D-erythritol 2,4-cyclodiphosphate synthase [Bacteroidales bacterium]